MELKPRKVISLLLAFLFLFQQTGLAQGLAQLDIAGHLAGMRNSFVQDKFRPLHLRYLQFNPQENTFRLLLDKGDEYKGLSPKGTVPDSELEDISKKLLEYFLIGLSLPNDSFWVNLRPDSPDNIIDPFLEETDIGRIMLETDLQLKKDTAAMTSPQTAEGREYWNKLYQKAGELFGNENITIPTLTRPWIVPDEIIVRETTDSAYIYKATLKVMLEQDYLKSPQSIVNSPQYKFDDPRLKELNEYSSQLIRELIIPKLTKQVNSAKRYAALRQVYYSLIIAQWFKARYRAQSIVHSQQSIAKTNPYSNLIDSKNLANLASKENWDKAAYFQAYQKSFQDGEYKIQEPAYTHFGQTIRSYFSGGISGLAPAVGVFGQETAAVKKVVAGTEPIGNEKLLEVRIDSQGNPQLPAPRAQGAAGINRRELLSPMNHEWQGTLPSGNSAARGQEADATALAGVSNREQENVPDKAVRRKKAADENVTATVSDDFWDEDIKSLYTAKDIERLTKVILEEGSSRGWQAFSAMQKLLLDTGIFSSSQSVHRKIIEAIPRIANQKPELIQLTTIDALENIMNKVDRWHGLWIQCDMETNAYVSIALQRHEFALRCVNDLAFLPVRRRATAGEEIRIVTEGIVDIASHNPPLASHCLHGLLQIHSAVTGNELSTGEVTAGIARIITSHKAMYPLLRKLNGFLVAEGRKKIDPRSRNLESFNRLLNEGAVQRLVAEDKPLINREVVIRLKNIIKRKRKITFEEFMDISLYSEGGYYSGGKVVISNDTKEKADFVTYPELAPKTFGPGIAEQLVEMWGKMGKPENFQVIEMGAGNGTMAKTILDYLRKNYSDGLYKRIRYVILEISPELRKRQEFNLGGLPVTWISASAIDMDKFLSNIEGVFISNELPDAFPVHLIKRSGNGQLSEVYVVYRDGKFKPVLGPLSEPLKITSYVNRFKKMRGC